MKPKLPYILIAVLAGLLIFSFYLGYQRAGHLEQRSQAVEQRMDAWIQLLDTLTEQQRELTAKVTQKQIEKKAVRMDVGREIKQFNKTIKGIKQIEDPYESIMALDRAWAAD